jgi:hypothetical protein
MDTQTDEQIQDTSAQSGAAKSDTLAATAGNGVERNGRRQAASHASGSQDLALQYMEALRERRRIEPPGGLRIFNPDETPQERDVRIKEQLAGLEALREKAAALTEDEARIWDEVLRAVRRSRSGHAGGDDVALDS